MNDASKMIREDVALAMVAAAYEDAADEVTNWHSCDGGCVRARAPASAKAALNALLTEAEQRGYANAMEAERKLSDIMLDNTNTKLEIALKALEDIGDGMGETTLSAIGQFAPVIARQAIKNIESIENGSM